MLYAIFILYKFKVNFYMLIYNIILYNTLLHHNMQFSYNVHQSLAFYIIHIIFFISVFLYKIWQDGFNIRVSVKNKHAMYSVGAEHWQDVWKRNVFRKL